MDAREKKIRRRNRLVRWLPVVLSSVLRVIGATLRWRLDMPPGTRRLLSSGKPVILAFWHGRMVMMPFLFRRACDWKGRLWALVSQHWDGEIIARTGRDQSAAQFALRWLFNRSEVSCVLSGMSSLDEVRENIEFASHDHIGTLSDEEMKLYAEARAVYQKRTRINCTQCGYCMPCEQKIPISFILELYNDAYMYDARDNSRRAYRVFIKPENRPYKCTQCGTCEERCPQNVPIIESLQEAHESFTQD